MIRYLVDYVIHYHQPVYWPAGKEYGIHEIETEYGMLYNITDKKAIDQALSYAERKYLKRPYVKKIEVGLHRQVESDYKKPTIVMWGADSFNKRQWPRKKKHFKRKFGRWPMWWTTPESDEWK